MHRPGRRRCPRFRADAEDVALLDQERGGPLVEAGAVGAVRADVQKLLGAGAPAPAGAKEHPGAAWDAAMLGFPGEQLRGWMETMFRESGNY